MVDPTRRIKNAKNVKIFERKEIEMHHMSFVRNDIGHKIQNSSGRDGFVDKNDIIRNYQNFQYSKENHPNLQVVENVFNIEL